LTDAIIVFRQIRNKLSRTVPCHSVHAIVFSSL